MKKVLINGVETEVEDDYQEEPSNTPASATPPAIDPSVVAAYQQELLNTARQNNDLRRQLDEARRQPVAPVAPPTPEEEKTFFDRPRSSTQEIVKQELERTVGPINQFIAGQQRVALYNELKGQMRNLPAQFPYISQVESYVDQLMANVDVNPGNLAGAYNQAVGYMLHSGQLQTGTPANNPSTNTPAVNTPTIPAHVRSSAPPPRVGGGTTKSNVRQLNENEKKIARHNGWSEAEYIVWTEKVSSNEVAHITADEIKRRVEAL